MTSKNDPLGAVLPRFMTLTDVAEELQISTAAVRTMVLKGELEAFQIGGRGQWRIDSQKFEEFIEQLHEEQRQRVVESEHTEQRSEEHTSELQSRGHLVCRHLLEKKN